MQKLWRSADEIIACLDGDNAGVRASNRLIELALPSISSKKTICAFLLEHPDLIVDYAQQPRLKDETLNNFNNWLANLSQGNTKLDRELIAEKAKNTEFAHIFTSLSSFDSSICIPSKTKNIDRVQTLAWLRKQHYLAILENEYTSISGNNTTLAKKQEMIQSYIQEIRKTVKELSELKEKLRL